MNIEAVDWSSAKYHELADANGTVFNSPRWLKIYDDRLKVLGIYNLNNELIGAFNVYQAKKFGITYLIVPPFSPSNALFFINPAINTSARNAFEKEVHTSVCAWFKKQGAALSISAFPIGITDMQVYFWNNFKVVPNYTYHLNLSPS